MKRKFTKITSCLLCLAMLFSMAMPALAVRADDDAIPIDAPAPDEDGGSVLDLNDFFEDAEASLLANENPFDVTGEYEIYPTPHSVTYADSTVTLPATMPVVYTGDIDSYTKDRAVEAFKEAGVTLSESASPSGVALRVSIKADGDGVTAETPDLFAKTSAYKLTIDGSGVTVVGVDTDAAFYGLTTVKRILQQVTNKRVKHLTVEDYADIPVRGFIEGYYGNPWTVEDRKALMEFGGDYKMNIYFYAPKDDPKHRNDWKSLYTEKELDDLIKPLAEAGNKSKCYYGYALHPFAGNCFRFDTQAHYEEDLAALKAKFLQVIKVGVRQIALLGDDAVMPDNNLDTDINAYVKVLNDLTDWVEELRTTGVQDSQGNTVIVPDLRPTVPFCAGWMRYADSTGNDDVLKSLAPQGVKAGKITGDVPIVMTGGRVWGDVGNSFINNFTSNVGVGPFLWINWPCTDNSQTALTMGAHNVILRSDLTDENAARIKGIMLNPMQQSEPSKAGIFQNADYAWNVWNDPETSEQRIADVWDDCFKYVDHDSAIETAESAALRELSKHMIHQKGNGNNNYDESFELSPKLNAFLEKLEADTLTTADVAAMKSEFQTLYDAAHLYNNKTSGNLRILGSDSDADGIYPTQREQMAPWLDCWEEFTSGALQTLDALSCILNNADGSKDNQIVQHYLAAQNLLERSKTHRYFYVDNYKNAEVGTKHIAPFVDTLFTKVAKTAQLIIDPNYLPPFAEEIITNRTDVPRGSLAAMRDGNEGTDACFQNPNSIAVGDYVGVQYNRSIQLTALKFVTGAIAKSDGGSANDRFNDCKLQYMDENGDWQDIPGATYTHDTCETMAVTGLNLTVKGVRAIATSARTNTWFGIKEIYITTESELATGQLTGSVIRTSVWEVYESSSKPESNLMDGNDQTYVWYNVKNGDYTEAGDYIGLDLGRVVKNVGRVRFVVGASSGDKASNKWTQYKLQYSADGTTWTDVKSYTGAASGPEVVEEDLGSVEARYVRLVNTLRAHTWVQFSEISVWADEAAAAARIIYQSDAVKKVTNPVAALSNSEASLTADNVMLRPGEFVGVALPKVRAITDIVADFTPVPGLVLKVGLNEAELYPVDIPAQASVAQLFAAEDSVIDYNAPARYVRLENEGEQTISFQLNELTVHSDAIEEISFLDSNIDGNSGGYPGQDARNMKTTGNWFDGDILTVATYANVQHVGDYVTYDLGQVRSVKKLTAVIASAPTSNNYIRQADLQISMDNENWTTVAQIARPEGAQDADGPADAGWQNYSVANFVHQSGELAQAQDARYLRVYLTGASGYFPALGEIFINDGEYISTYSDATIVADPIEPSAEFTPDKMRDGDLTTGFKPNMDGVTSGSLVYRLSDETSIGQINLVQGETSGVKLSIRPVGEADFRAPVSLSGGLSQTLIDEDITGVAEIKLTWENVTPIFYELITIPRDAVVKGGGQASSEVETIPINSYSGNARKVNFDENWKFNLGDVSGAEAQVFNDSAWRTLNLPHDYSIEGEYSDANEAESGYLRGGPGWYRKSFTVDPSWENKTVSIDFGGVYMNAEVYLNGVKLGEHHYGYTPFSFVLTNLKTNGENVIAVKTDDAFPSSRWYSGAGIYRSVHLTVSDPIHVARYGTFVNPVKGSGNSWMVNINTTVQNDAASNASVTVEQAIYELNAATYEKGAKFAETSSAATVSPAARASASVAQTISVQNPKLWNSWDKGEPNLYVLVTTVKQDGTVVDTYETEFGFREIDWDVDDGFKLNGKTLKLKGVCQHHDQGALGSEAWYRALERQVDILMEMGCNSIRVTHNPAADELIEICNRKGVLVIDEIFDGWANAKNGNSGDFSRWFNATLGESNALVGGAPTMKWRQFVAETVANRDKNAPCVIMYSLSNEVQEGGGMDANFVTYASELIGWLQAIDNTRYITRGDNSRTVSDTVGDKGDQSPWHNAINTAIHEAGGAVGFNYCSENRMAQAHSNGWLMYGAETASSINSRGVYTNKRFTSNSWQNAENASHQDGAGKLDRLTSYDKNNVSWGSTASDAWWRTIRYDYNAGEYVWTGFDYIGEPTPWNGTGTGKVGTVWPKSSFFGIIDTNGIPKDSYYLYRSMWNDKSHTLHILPTWDQDDVVIDGSGKVEVVVYTDAPMVKLYLNNVEVGSATSTTHITNAGHVYRTFNSGTDAFVRKDSNSHETLYATFNVTYAEGILRAVACDENGQPLNWVTEGRKEVKTTSGAAKLTAAADRATIKNDGRDLSYVTIDVVDSKGEIVNSADNQIKVTVTGDGVLVGMDNGVQGDHTSYLSDTRKAGAGRLVAIIQSTKEEGSFTVTASADGLTPAAVTVSTGGAITETGDDTPVSYDLSKTIYVQLNTEPDLPKTATVTLGSGRQVTKAINWKAYDDSLLTTPGAEFAITGVIADYNIPVSIGVVVLDDVAALLNYSAAVQVGQVPILPSSRPAVMANGTVVSAQFEVDWDLPDDPEELAKLFRKAGKVIVNGTADVFGETYNVTATIRVATATIVEGKDVMIDVSAQPGNFAINGEDTEANRAILNDLRDGDTFTAAYTGSGPIYMAYDTAQNLIRIKLTYADAVPASSNVTVALDSGPVTVRPTVSGKTVIYELGEVNSSTGVTLTFASEVSLAEAELISGTPVFPIGSTAELDGMNINGQPVSDTQLASKNIQTSSINGVINPISNYNVAVTILPENKDSKIILVTESENHAQRAIYTVQLEALDELPANDDTLDYPYAQTTVFAPSEAKSGADGPDDNVIDGNTSTHWHSRYAGCSNGTGQENVLQGNNIETYHQNYIQLTLQEATELAALRQYPRNDSSNGRISDYEVKVSNTTDDDSAFTTVATGRFEDRAAWQIAMFDKAVTAKYVRLYALGSYGNVQNKDMAIGELRVVKTPDTTKIDLSEAVITVEPNEFEWKNVGIRPGTGTEGATVTVTLRGNVLTLHEDYELGYENNIDPGTAYIYARAKDGTNYQGAAAATFTIFKTEAKITSFRPVTVPVQPGIDPTDSLPAKVMAFTNSADGLPMEVEVTWDAVPAEWYNFPKEKTRPLTGTVDPDLLSDPDLKPTATLKFAYSQSVDSISMVTAVGVLPSLPETVTVQFDDGTSGQRTVSQWYVKGDATKAALTAADFAAEGTVELEGDIVGIDRVKAAATVRVDTATANPDNIALNTSGTGIPFAMASYSSNADPVSRINNGQRTGVSTSTGKSIWCDWQKNTYHDAPWVAVALDGTLDGNTYTPKPKLINKVNIGFLEEDEGNDSHKVSLPASYKVEYYTGPVGDLTLGDNKNVVSGWANSPLNDNRNWTELQPNGTKPSIPSDVSEANHNYIEYTFAPVMASIVRVVMTPQSEQWVGMEELEVYGLTPPTANSDFTVTSVTLGGEEKLGSFVTDSSVTNGKMLEVTLPANSDATKDIPKLAVTATDNASISVVQAARVPGMAQAGGAWAQAVVTSEDGSKTETYTVKFKRTGAAAGFFIELDDNFPTDKLQLVNASGKPVTGATPNTEITLQIAKGYQGQVWVEITEGDRMGEVLVLSNTNTSFLMPAASVHVYGSAMPITYNIKYLLNGGSFVGDPRVTYNVETATFSVNDPTRPGYTFKGWVGGGLTQPTTGLTIAKGSIGDRTYTAVWEINGSIGGGGGNNGGGSVSVPVGDVTVTTKNPDGSTTVTTTTSGGLVSAVTTAPDGTQSAVIQIPQNSGTPTKAVMPALDVTADKTPEVTVQNNTGRPLSVVVPVNGASTVVAVRTNADGSETVIPYSVMDENGLRIKVASDSQTLKLMDNKKTFDDVPGDHWSLGAVDFVSSRELFNGMGSASTFAPAAPMDRAMMTTVLWRLAEKPNAAVTELFADVQSGSYYEQAVAWGVATGVVKGTDIGFEPNSPVTRETLAVLLYRAAGSPAVVDELPRRFVDGAQVADWAQEAMIWCVQNDIIKGYPDNTLGAKNVATRAEVATMLQRFVIHQI